MYKRQPLHFSTSEVPEETTIRESEEPEEQEIPAPLELSVSLMSEGEVRCGISDSTLAVEETSGGDLPAQFISAVDEIPVSLHAETVRTNTSITFSGFTFQLIPMDDYCLAEDVVYLFKVLKKRQNFNHFTLHVKGLQANLRVPMF